MQRADYTPSHAKIIITVQAGLVTAISGGPPGLTIEVWDYDVSDNENRIDAKDTPLFLADWTEKEEAAPEEATEGEPPDKDPYPGPAHSTDTPPEIDVDWLLQHLGTFAESHQQYNLDSLGARQALARYLYKQLAEERAQ